MAFHRYQEGSDHRRRRGSPQKDWFQRVGNRKGKHALEVHWLFPRSSSLWYAHFICFFSRPFSNHFPVMEIAVLLAAGLRNWIDFGVIIGILMLNAIVGWYQEKQAADVVASLKGDIAMKAIVVRDGQEQEIKARELVPGDIVRYFSTHSSWPIRLLIPTSLFWKKAWLWPVRPA